MATYPNIKDFYDYKSGFEFDSAAFEQVPEYVNFKNEEYSDYRFEDYIDLIIHIKSFVEWNLDWIKETQHNENEKQEIYVYLNDCESEEHLFKVKFQLDDEDMLFDVFLNDNHPSIKDEQFNIGLEFYRKQLEEEVRAGAEDIKTLFECY